MILGHLVEGRRRSQGDIRGLVDVQATGGLIAEIGTRLIVEWKTPTSLDGADDAYCAVDRFGKLGRKIEMLGEFPRGLHVGGGASDAQHGTTPDTRSPASGLPGRQGHELDLALHCRQVVFPHAAKPIGNERADDQAVEAKAVSGCCELGGINGNALRSTHPGDNGGQHAGVNIGVDSCFAVVVEESPTGLQEENFHGIDVGMPEIEQVAIGSAVAVEVLNQWFHYAGKVIPRFDGGYVNTGLFDQVCTIAEQDGVDVVRKAEYSSARCPGAETRIIDFIKKPLVVQTLSQVQESHGFNRPGEEEARHASLDLDEISYWRVGEEPGEQSAFEGFGADYENTKRRLISVVIIPSFDDGLVVLHVSSRIGPHLHSMMSVAGAEQDENGRYGSYGCDHPHAKAEGAPTSRCGVDIELSCSTAGHRASCLTRIIATPGDISKLPADTLRCSEQG